MRLALQGGHIEVAHLLVEYGVDAAGMDNQVVPSWQMALHQGDMELARLFEHDVGSTA